MLSARPSAAVAVGGGALEFERWDLKGPLENIVVSGVYAVAPTRYSLFSPLSPSLYRHFGALWAPSPLPPTEVVKYRTHSRKQKEKPPIKVVFLFGR